MTTPILGKWLRFGQQHFEISTVIVPSQTSHPSRVTTVSKSKGLIELNHVFKIYESAAGKFVALKDVSLSVHPGEFVGIVGKSGCGKSTLINAFTGIDRPSSGEVIVNGTNLNNLSEGKLAEWRGRNVGVIFQFFQLLPMLSAIENVMVPMDFCNRYHPRERPERAMFLLEQVGVAGSAHKSPSAMSGGQQQRVAIARALANDPPLVVADEPTGNLDSRTASAVFDLFAGLVDGGKTIVMVTHDRTLARRVSRTVTLADGEIVGDITKGMISTLERSDSVGTST